MYSIGLILEIEDFFVEGFNIFPVHIGESKFIPCNEARLWFSEGISESLRKGNTGSRRQVVRKVGINHLQMLNMTPIQREEGEGTEKSSVWSFFITVL